jgi:hypothetical protein
VMARNSPLLRSIFYISVLSFFTSWEAVPSFYSVSYFPFLSFSISVTMREKVWSEDFEENCIEVLT